MSNYEATGNIISFTGEISFISEERTTKTGKPVTNLAVTVVAGRAVKRLMCVAFGSLSKIAQMYSIGEIVTFNSAVEQLNSFTDEAGNSRRELQYIINDIAPADSETAETADLAGDTISTVEAEIPF